MGIALLLSGIGFLIVTARLLGTREERVAGSVKAPRPVTATG